MNKCKHTMVIVEYIGDGNNWEWYDTVLDTTPEKALKESIIGNCWDAKEDGKLTFTGDGAFIICDQTDYRAFYHAGYEPVKK